MTVITPTPIVRLPWGGNSEPGLPTGIWTVLAQVTGDATGGDQVATVVFHTAGNPLAALLYSLEQLNVHVTGVGADRALFVQLNTGWDQVQWFLTEILNMDFNAIGTLTATLDPEKAKAMSGRLLGGPIRSGSTSELSFAIINGNTDVLTVSAQGYVWDQASLQVPGGPRLPADSVLRSR